MVLHLELIDHHNILKSLTHIRSRYPGYASTARRGVPSKIPHRLYYSSDKIRRALNLVIISCEADLIGSKIKYGDDVVHERVAQNIRARITVL